MRAVLGHDDEGRVTAADWLIIGYGVFVLAYAALFVWGERRSERYYDDLDARVAKLRAERGKAGR